MTEHYTVRPGALDGPRERSTDSPAEALAWAREMAARWPNTFVCMTDPGHGPTVAVWNTVEDRYRMGRLHEAVLREATAPFMQAATP